MHNIETENYHLVHSLGNGRGTFTIIRKLDHKTAYAFLTREVYHLFEAAHAISPAAFDALCRTEQYS